MRWAIVHFTIYTELNAARNVYEWSCNVKRLLLTKRNNAYINLNTATQDFIQGLSLLTLTSLHTNQKISSLRLPLQMI